MSTENKQFSDIELVLYMTGYNITAYEQFYERYSPRVYSLIRKIIPDARVAQSLLLNVFGTFLKRIDLYDTSKDNVFTWLMLLTRNISLDVARKIKHKTELKPNDDDYELNFLIPKLSSSINEINSYNTAEKIKLYKDHLTEIQNLILSVAYYEGLSEEELAKRLNLPSEKIRERIIDAMDTLMGLYCEHEKFTDTKKEMIDLIKLDVLGCLSEADKNHFNLLKNNSSNFLWKEYGDYQNLIALISTSLTVEHPPREILEKVIHNVESVVSGKVSDYAVNLKPEPKKETDAEVKNNSVETKKLEDRSTIRFKEPDHNPIFAFKKQDIPNRFNEVVSPLAKSDKEIKNINPKTETKISTKVPERKELPKTMEIRENKIAARSLQPTSERFNVNVRREDPQIQAKEIKETTLNDNKTVQAKTILPNSERYKTSIKKDQPIVEKKVVPEVVNKSGNLFKESRLQPTSERFNTELNKVPESVENKASKSEPQKEAKPLNSTALQNENKDLNLKSKIEKPISADNTSKTITPDKEISKEGKEKPIENFKAKEKESVKIDKIISKIEEENASAILAETELPENDEVLKLKKKLRRNFYLSAAVIVFLLLASGYVYMKFSNAQNNPVKTTTNNLAKSEVTPAINKSDLTSDVSTAPSQIEEKKENLLLDPQKPITEKVDSSIKMIPPVLPQDNEHTEKSIDSNALIISNEKPLETTVEIVSKSAETAPISEIKKVEKEPEFFVAVEEQPQMVGGLEGLQRQIKYPELADKLGIEGKVIIQAIVDENGNVASAKVLKGIGGGCNEIAMNAVKNTKFIPGKQRGKPVKVQLAIPIVFKK